MAAIVQGNTAFTFGLTDQVGLAIQSASAKKMASKVELTDADGDIVALAFHGFKVTHTLSGKMSGFSSGVASALVLANLSAFSGAGTVFIDEVDLSGSNTDFQNVSISATQYPSI